MMGMTQNTIMAPKNEVDVVMATGGCPSRHAMIVTVMTIACMYNDDHANAAQTDAVIVR